MSLSLNTLNQWNSNLANFVMFTALQNTVLHNDLNKITTDWESEKDNNYFFNNRVEKQGKITNQKSSGRCWMFAGLNLLRNQFIKKYNLPKDFELSQTYLFFYDKLERGNFFLENIIKNRELGVDDRLIQHLLDEPLSDGGHWATFVNLVNKYGVMPKSAYPETYHSGATRKMNWVLGWKLREFAREILIANDKTEDELREKKMEFLKEYHQLISLFLGTPPAHFDWVYEDKDDKYHIFKNLTGKDMSKMIDLDLNEFISISNDPRNDYGKKLRVTYFGNILEGQPIIFYNDKIETLIDLTAKSIKNNIPVWFGCDVGKWLHKEKDAMDLKLTNYDVLGTTFKMSKKDKLTYRLSSPTHAMVFTGFENDNLTIKKWRVENSWGSKGINDGYYSMTHDWFKEYVYEVIIPKSMLEKDYLEKFGEEEVILPPWDPMGSLA